MARYIIVLAALIIAAALPAGATDAEFDGMWHDGRAELDGYQLVVSRYGEVRRGTCVMVYVTEPFSESKRVKVDDAAKNPGDTFDALKLNMIRDFQTGIYDYNTMVSVFVRTDDFSTKKISFSSAEWCGHVYEELLFRPNEITGHYYSYFEDESGPLDIDAVEGGVAADALFILLRGLRRDYLAPGETQAVKLLPSVYAGRLSHRRPQWVGAKISRRADSKKVKVPAGEFAAMVYDLETADGGSGTFYIETAYPHRIVRWEMLPDVRAELAGSARLSYWKLNHNGNESYLSELGLTGESVEEGSP